MNTLLSPKQRHASHKKRMHLKHTLLAALVALLAVPGWLAASAQNAVPEMADPISKISKVKDSKVAHDTPASEKKLTLHDASQPLTTAQASDNSRKAPASKTQKMAQTMTATGGGTFKAPARPRRASTVTLPSGLTVEEWNISTNFYNVGASGFITFHQTVKVAIDGNDIYIAGLDYWLTDAWVKGTINGTTATFETGQYFGDSGGDDYFVGIDTDEGNVADVTFTYSAAAHKLTLPDNMRILIGADTEGGYYAYHINTVIAKEYVAPPVEIQIADGSDPSTRIPVYGQRYRTAATSQMIYPASMLNSFQDGQTIKSVTFYTNDNGIQFSGGQITATIGTTTSTYFTTSNGTVNPITISGTTATATVVPVNGSKTLKIIFDNPIVYSAGSNIIIQLRNTRGTAGATTWMGVQYSTNTQYYSYNSVGEGNNNRPSAGRYQFLPKATFELQFPPVSLTDELDFEAVAVGQSKTLTAYVENSNSDNVTATITATAPFSVASSTATFRPGANAVDVTFTPTGPDAYNGTLTINVNGTDIVIPLKGVGTVDGPEAIRDEAFFDGITYKWTDSEGGKHTSKLTDVATDPDQMIAMIRKVYMDKTIPGNYKRGFTANGGNETWNDVNYAGVGRISAEIDGSTISFGYANNYGWNIPGTIKMDSQAAEYNNNSGTFYYSYMDSTQYKPYNEGVTLLLVEMVDDYSTSNFTSAETGAYAYLRDLISKSIKSIRIVPQAKRTGTGFDAGTLFKIDCDKMNKFFLMAKGQLRWIYNSYFAEYDYDGSTYNLHEYFSGNPCYIYCNDYYNPINGFFDDRSFPLFYNMFEEFSPVANDATVAQGDIYQDLVNMESFGVEHDCMGVPMMGHEFMMYGADSEAADCADVRDLMFFVPDYRMMKWDGRESHIYQKFMNYNTAHLPTMGLYVIRQDDIVDTRHDDDHYMLTLTWESNLDNFLPTDEQYYELLQVLIDDDGNETYVPVYYMNDQGQYLDGPNGQVTNQPVPIKLTLSPTDSKTYTEVYVERDQASKQVTYVIRGCDKGNFLTLKSSNKESFIIPGKDPAEMLTLKDATHYSRYNPQTQTNCYSNKIQLINNPLGMKQNAVQPGVILEIFRDYGTGDDLVSTCVTTITVTDKNTRTLNVEMKNQSLKSEFPAGKSSGTGAGYHLNHNSEGNTSWTQTYSVAANDVISLDNLVVFDNFVVDVSANEHPGAYTYRVVTTYTDNTIPGQVAHSNTFTVPIYKTASRINEAFTKEQVDADTNFPEVGQLKGVEFGAQLRYSSKTEILRYDAYRWNEGETRYIVEEVGEGDDETDIAPTGMAGNQDGSYTVSMNDVKNEPEYYTTSSVTVDPGETDKWAVFVDKKADNIPGGYVYAPVIETFAVGKDLNNKVRRDYNTYGGPLQTTATGRLEVSANKPEKSTYRFYKNGVPYCYYTMTLDWKTIADELNLVPEGYDIYKVRAWRKIDRQYLGEQLDDRQGRMGNDEGEYLFEEFTYMDVDKAHSNQMPLGNRAAGDNNEKSGTFGAIDINAEGAPASEIPVTFVVRLYFTSEADLAALPQPSLGAPRRAAGMQQANGKYYISEVEINTTIKGGTESIVTAIDDLHAGRQVEQVTYYNATGMASSKPFAGVNVVVTRYTDGSTSTAKQVVR